MKTVEEIRNFLLREEDEELISLSSVMTAAKESDTDLPAVLQQALRITQQPSRFTSLSTKERQASAIALLALALECINIVNTISRKSSTRSLEASRLLNRALPFLQDAYKLIEGLEIKESVELPGPFNSSETDDFISPVAVRFLKDNEDIGEDAAEGDPATDMDSGENPEEGSEASPEDLEFGADGAAETIINTLADKVPDEEKKPNESRLPRSFNSPITAATAHQIGDDRKSFLMRLCSAE